MKRLSPSFRCLAVAATIAGLIHPLAGVAQTMRAPAQVVTHKSIPLDCGGWFSGIVAHSSGRIYGYGDVFGFWRSDDAGQTWRDLQGDLTTNESFVNGAAVDPKNADTVYFRSGSKLFKSVNGGATWATLLTGLQTDLVRGASPILVHPGNSQEIWLAAGRTGLTGRLWRSTDGGTSWSKSGGTTFDSVVTTTVYVRPEFPLQVWVGTKGALYASANRGTSWTKVWNNGGQNNAFTGQPSVVNAVVRRADGMGYMAADVGGYRVTATNWSNPATYQFIKTISWWNGWGPSNATVLADGRFVSGGGGNGTGNPNDLQDAQRISSDGGLTWTQLTMRMSAESPTPVWRRPPLATEYAPGGRDFIVQDPSLPSRWFMTTGMGPVISHDSGATWSYPPNANGLAGVMTYRVRFARNNRNVAYIPASDLGMFSVNDGGRSGSVSAASNPWLAKHVTLHEVMSSDNGQTLVGAGVDQTNNRNLIQKSNDAGATWYEMNLASTGLPLSSEGITHAVMAPGNANDYLVLLGAGGTNSNPGLWRTTNGGVTFAKVPGIPDGLDTGMRYHPENSQLETDHVQTNVRYLSIRGVAFYRSTNSGAVWTQTATTPFGSDWIQSLGVDKGTAGRVWAAGGYRGLARSDNGGDTWATVSYFSDASFVDAAYGRIAVWGKRGPDTWKKLYYSADNGAKWAELTGPGHRLATLRDLAVDPWVPGKVWVSGVSVNVVYLSPRQ